MSDENTTKLKSNGSSKLAATLSLLCFVAVIAVSFYLIHTVQSTKSAEIISTYQIAQLKDQLSLAASANKAR